MHKTSTSSTSSSHENASSPLYHSNFEVLTPSSQSSAPQTLKSPRSGIQSQIQEPKLTNSGNKFNLNLKGINSPNDSPSASPRGQNLNNSNNTKIYSPISMNDREKRIVPFLNQKRKHKNFHSQSHSQILELPSNPVCSPGATSTATATTAAITGSPRSTKSEQQKQKQTQTPTSITFSSLNSISSTDSPKQSPMLNLKTQSPRSGQSKKSIAHLPENNNLSQDSPANKNILSIRATPPSHFFRISNESILDKLTKEVKRLKEIIAENDEFDSKRTEFEREKLKASRFWKAREEEERYNMKKSIEKLKEDSILHDLTVLELQKQKDLALDSQEQISQQLEKKKKRILKLKRELEQEKSKNSTLCNEIQEMNSMLDGLNATFLETQNQFESTSKNLEERELEIHELQQKFDELQESNAKTISDLQDARSTVLEKLKIELEARLTQENEERIEEIEGRYAEQIMSMEKLHSLELEPYKSQKNLKLEIDKLRQELEVKESLKLEIEKLKAEIGQKQKELEENSQKSAENEKKISVLCSEFEKMHEIRSENEKLKQTLSEKIEISEKLSILENENENLKKKLNDLNCSPKIETLSPDLSCLSSSSSSPVVLNEKVVEDSEKMMKILNNNTREVLDDLEKQTSLLKDQESKWEEKFAKQAANFQREIDSITKDKEKYKQKLKNSKIIEKMLLSRLSPSLNNSLNTSSNESKSKSPVPSPNLGK